MNEEIVSSVLIREEEGEQKPIYYTSQVLKGFELNYPPLEKLALVIIITTTKLKPYFEAIQKEVRKNYSPRKVLY